MQNVYIAGDRRRARAGGASARPVVQCQAAEPLRHGERCVRARQVPRRYTRADGVLASAPTRSGACATSRRWRISGWTCSRRRSSRSCWSSRSSSRSRRQRPDGSNHQSFPSGHAAVTFATATVIERHLGWRKVAPRVWHRVVRRDVTHPRQPALSQRRGLRRRASASIAGRTVVHHRGRLLGVLAGHGSGGGVALMISRTRWGQ